MPRPWSKCYLSMRLKDALFDEVFEGVSLAVNAPPPIAALLELTLNFKLSGRHQLPHKPDTSALVPRAKKRFVQRGRNFLPVARRVTVMLLSALDRQLTIQHTSRRRADFSISRLRDD